ncbi:MAG: putative antitoxin of bacterial toxin-antitoxin system, YdaS/YdaT [Chloroflexota bacterium]
MTTKEERVAAIKEAIQRGGGIIKFAKSMGVSHQAVYNWMRRGWVPLERAVVIEAIFGIMSEQIVEPSVRSALDMRAATSII